jgi:monoamine oxidase
VWGPCEGVSIGEFAPWMDAADLDDLTRVCTELAALSHGVNPDDPWGHPEAARLDSLSVGAWMRSVGARPGVIRLAEITALSLSIDSIERTSLLAHLRKEAAGGGHGFYDVMRWETLRVAEGSATVALRMAEELGERLRRGGGGVRAAAGAAARSCRHWRVGRPPGVASPPALRARRQDRGRLPGFVLGRGGATTEGNWASVRIQREGIVSALTRPDRLGPLLATPPGRRREEFLATLAALMGDEALHPLLHAERLWATDPFTRGYVTAWWPDDVMAVGPLHGTHEPPFYVCGSDQWVAGYMEGAVRTGRDAASQALELGPREFLAVA